MRGTYFLTRPPENLLATLSIYPQDLANCLLHPKKKLQVEDFYLTLMMYHENVIFISYISVLIRLIKFIPFFFKEYILSCIFDD